MATLGDTFCGDTSQVASRPGSTLFLASLVFHKKASQYPNSFFIASEEYIT